MQGKKRFVTAYAVYLNTGLIIMCLLFSFGNAAYAQDIPAKDSVAANVKDVGDVFRKLFHKKVDTNKKAKSVVILPSLGYNPSFGFVFGAKASAIKQYGVKENTDLSSFGLEASYSTKGIITVQARHNIFTLATNGISRGTGNYQSLS